MAKAVFRSKVNRGYKIGENTKRAAQRRDTQRLVLAFVEGGDGIQVRDLVFWTGKSESTVRRALNQLLEQDKVYFESRLEGSRYYHLWYATQVA